MRLVEAWPQASLLVSLPAVCATLQLFGFAPPRAGTECGPRWRQGRLRDGGFVEYGLDGLAKNPDGPLPQLLVLLTLQPWTMGEEL